MIATMRSGTAKTRNDSSALANKLQRKGRAKLNLLILAGSTMNYREFLAKDGKNVAFRLG